MKHLLSALILSAGLAACQPEPQPVAEPEIPSEPVAEEATAEAPASAEEIIWAKELAIYEARGEGDISVYLENTADGFSAWPPFTDTPYGRDVLEAIGGGTNGGDQEELTMELVSFTQNGDSAIIYYQTHMTRSADGTPVDYRYEVTHTWANVDGEWQVLGGMARAMPERGEN